MAIPADKNPPRNKTRKSLVVASSAKAMLYNPPHIAARAMHIMISCENFIRTRFASSIGIPGVRTTIGCSTGFESVNIVPVA